MYIDILIGWLLKSKDFLHLIKMTHAKKSINKSK